MSVLLQMDFPTPGPWGTERTTELAERANSIAAAPGLYWKLWTENRDAGLAGGIYLFEDAVSAESYRVMHVARLTKLGTTDIRVITFAVNTPLSAITHADLAHARPATSGRHRSGASQPPGDAGGAVLLQMDFPSPGPWGAEMTTAYTDLARDIAATPGLRWKLWTENRDGGQAGGVYLFDDETAAVNYRDRHTTRLAGFGLTDIRAVLFTVNPSLSGITHAAL